MGLIPRLAEDRYSGLPSRIESQVLAKEAFIKDRIVGKREVDIPPGRALVQQSHRPKVSRHIYHVLPWKPARDQSSSAKATTLKTVRTACNRFQRARSSATRTLCKSSVGSSNCLLVGRMKASVKGIEAPRSAAPVAVHASRSCHAATRPRTRPTRASDTCMIVARR